MPTGERGMHRLESRASASNGCDGLQTGPDERRNASGAGGSRQPAKGGKGVIVEAAGRDAGRPLRPIQPGNSREKRWERPGGHRLARGAQGRDGPTLTGLAVKGLDMKGLDVKGLAARQRYCAKYRAVSRGMTGERPGLKVRASKSRLRPPQDAGRKAANRRGPPSVRPGSQGPHLHVSVGASAAQTPPRLPPPPRRAHISPLRRHAWTPAPPALLFGLGGTTLAGACRSGLRRSRCSWPG